MSTLDELRQVARTIQVRSLRLIAADLCWNAFCPTGKGGGIDPTCSPHGQSVTTTLGLEDQLPIDSYGQRSGTKPLGPIKLKAYRVGAVEDKAGRGGVFFAGEPEGALPYARLHEGLAVEEYSVSLENAILAGHQNDLTKLFFGKTYAEVMDTFQRKYGKQGAHVASGKFDKKLLTEAKKRGYDGIVYVRPAPPAKTEVVVIGKSGGRVTTNVLNVFCPTGEGGGVDPTCGKGGQAALPPAAKVIDSLADKVGFNETQGFRYSELIIGNIRPNVWYKKNDNEDTMLLETSEGSQFLVSANVLNASAFGAAGTNISFADSNGSYGVTGYVGPKGALEVFRGVSSGVVAHVDKHNPILVHFSAEEPSRQRLYDKLVKTVSKVRPDYVAIAFLGKWEGKHYLVVKRDQLQTVVQKVKAYAMEKDNRSLELETIVNAAEELQIEYLTAEVDPQWLTEKFWAKELGATSNVFCPTGEGGGVDPTCSPGGTRVLGRPLPGVEWKSNDSGVSGEGGQIDSQTKLSYVSISSHNEVTPAEIDGEHELEAMKATLEETRAFWASDSPDARAIRKSDYLDGEPNAPGTMNASLNIIMTADKSNVGAGSGGPGSARVFWAPYSLPNREERLGEVYNSSLGVDPMYVLAHELHHAYGHGSELDNASDVAAIASHLSTNLKFNRTAVERYVFTQVAAMQYNTNAEGKMSTRANQAGRRLRYLHQRHPEQLQRAAIGNIVDTEDQWKSVISQFNSIGKRKTKPATTTNPVE